MADSLYSTLITMAWQNTAVLLSVFVLLYLFRRKDAVLLKTIAVICLVKLMIPPLLPLTNRAANQALQPLHWPVKAFLNAPAATIQSDFNFINLIPSFWIIGVVFVFIKALYHYRRLNQRFKNVQYLADATPGQLALNFDLYQSTERHSPPASWIF